MKARKVLISGITIAVVAISTLVFVGYPPFKAMSRSLRRTEKVNFPGFGIWLPPDYVVHGIDISKHQGRINWESVSEHVSNDIGISFIFMKATEGKSIKDVMFQDNWKQAQEVNMLRGAYHFFRPHLTADEQFILFKSQVKLVKEDLPPVLDVEIKGSCPPARLKKSVKRWLEMAEKYYGVTPILYTNYSFYSHYFSGKEFNRYPLWIAHYATDDLNRLTTKWNFWQHNESGRVKGIKGDVDFNVFKGNFNELLKLCKK
ncbi:MAG: glycoside hydrolase family 25 protein [Bacteroidia bacterium]|nr:glycoside hydrolase family 25 protein [Bacteroidia bacterium]